jgi:hypothetical protein
MSQREVVWILLGAVLIGAVGAGAFVVATYAAYSRRSLATIGIGAKPRQPPGRDLGRDMLWSPAIRAALLAGTPWLDVFCPGCGTSRAIDLRTLDRHPLASVGTLVLGLRCGWCAGTAPMPKLIGLFALPPARRAQTA